MEQENKVNIDVLNGMFILSSIMKEFGKNYNFKMELVVGKNWRDIPPIEWFPDLEGDLMYRLKKEYNKKYKKLKRENIKKGI